MLDKESKNFLRAEVEFTISRYIQDYDIVNEIATKVLEDEDFRKQIIDKVAQEMASRMVGAFLSQQELAEVYDREYEERWKED